MPASPGGTGPQQTTAPPGSAGQCSGIGGTGTQYDFAQLEGLWINAGGSRATAPIAAAIALAESGGCSAAVNPDDNNGTQTSWGIWQVSDGTHNQPPGILSPAANALAAVTKWQEAGQSFRDWGTFTSGAYKGFMSNATPDLSVPGSTTIGGATNIAQGVPADCAWGKIPGVLGGIWPGACIITYKQARELIGAGILAGGVLVMGYGIELLVGVAALGVAGKVAAPVVSRIAGARRSVRQVQDLGQQESPPPPPPAPAPSPARRAPADRSRYDYRRPENRQRLGPSA